MVHFLSGLKLGFCGVPDQRIALLVSGPSVDNFFHFLGTTLRKLSRLQIHCL